MITEDYHSILEAAAGLRITSARYLVHYFGSDAHVIAVAVGFSEGPAVIIKCGSDGESLNVAPGGLEKIDLEDLGRFEVVDAVKLDPAYLSACMDRYLNRVTLETGDGLLKAIRIECEGKTAFFSNVGDTLNFDEACFRQMMAEEGWGRLTAVSYPSNN